MDNKKVYLDTNIIADIIDPKRAQHLLSLELLEYFVLHDYTVVMSEDMITTLFYISKNKQETLLFFKELVFVDWEVVSFGLETLKKAIDLSIDNDLDVEDVLQCLCAKENECHMLITNDTGFYDCGVEIYTTEAFLGKYNPLELKALQNLTK